LFLPQPALPLLQVRQDVAQWRLREALLAWRAQVLVVARTSRP
jgi:hypothetical protein